MSNPMLGIPADPDQLDAMVAEDLWVFEPKIDGKRALVRVDDGKVTAFGRDGQRIDLPGPVAAAFRPLNVATFEFDGELVGDVFFAFDMPVAGQAMVPAARWETRHDLMVNIYKTWAPGVHVQIVPTAIGFDAKTAMVAQVVAGTGEGIMAKLVASPYTYRARPAQRTKAWRKIKRRHTVDCEVLWLGNDTGTGKLNMGLGVYKPGATAPTKIAECGALTGDGPRVVAGDVVEVTCLYASDDDRLVQPTKPMLRTDKAPTDCTFDQLDSARTDKNLLLHWSLEGSA